MVRAEWLRRIAWLLVCACLVMASLASDALGDDATLRRVLRAGMPVEQAEKVLAVRREGPLVVHRGYCSRIYEAGRPSGRPVELDIVPQSDDRWTVKAWRIADRARARSLHAMPAGPPTLVRGMLLGDALDRLEVWAVVPAPGGVAPTLWYASYRYPGMMVSLSLERGADGRYRLSSWSAFKRPDVFRLTPGAGKSD